MSFEEKGTWIQAVIVVLVPGIYFLTVFSQVRDTPVNEIAYQGPMLASIGDRDRVADRRVHRDRDRLAQGRRQER